ncbi:MAG TPA: glutamine--fructose-6-phosphate transaminase (isomerizing) [Candidatus Thermoplasmatota archaeon]
MCGIIGYTGPRQAQAILVEGLRRLEYRGYDSAGLAVAGPDGLVVQKRAGTVDALEGALGAVPPLAGCFGVGHTRWATHGQPTDANAHPFVDCTGRLMLVHNGIVENHQAMRERLRGSGHLFRSETDTEVLVHLVESYYAGDLVAAAARALREVEGTFAVVLAHADEPGRLVGSRRENPLVLGVGEGEMFLASDVPALLRHTRRVVYLDDDEVVAATPAGFEVRSLGDLAQLQPAVHTVEWDVEAAEKAGYKHFMLKEIFEQPRAIADSLLGRIGEADIDALTEGLRPVRRVKLLACGSSAHAGLVGRTLFEHIARVPATLEVASEYRYGPALPEDALIVAVTQSGETLDTLSALKEAKRRGSDALAVTNVVGSSITREVQRVIFTRAGPEIGVAASKTFTTQIVALVLLALSVGKRRGEVTPERLRGFQRELRRLPQAVQSVLGQNKEILRVATRYKDSPSMYFVGRGVNYPAALEGSHKLKEISYIHAEAYAGGELKHGANALLSAGLPVVAVAPADDLYAKMLSNIGEVTARGSPVIGVGTEGDTELRGLCEDLLLLPRTDPLLTPVTVTVALQLFAYHVADLKGCSVDKPRNLAKTVTVE